MSAIVQYQTTGGVSIVRHSTRINPKTALNTVLRKINTHRGAVFASGYEYPGRYSRWDIGFVNPPIEFVAHGRKFFLRALNKRGDVLLSIFQNALKGHPHIIGEAILFGDTLSGQVAPLSEGFPEEERLRQPTIFSVLRTLTQCLGSDRDPHLGFYGAVGYDVIHQIEPVTLRHPRDEKRPDLHLFLPDELVVTDHRKETAYRYLYDFSVGEYSTAGLPRHGEMIPYQRGVRTEKMCDHQPGEYAAKVEEIIKGARKGDFFEVVLSQVLSAGFPGTPSELFETIRRMNPSPYEFLINLGSEQLVGASPEMFVQVEGSRVETCPISGTIKRGRTAIEDADQILILLNSGKDKAELRMCSDVDRNDKARVCVPGSVKVVACRLIEMYSRLIHTVDHVEGILRPECDAFDALLAHLWAVTLTGAPKPVAIQTIENLENSERDWYGGTVGGFLCNGDIKTGITIRTVHLKKGIASIRVGSTLLERSDPVEEEKETQLKASAFMDAVQGVSKQPVSVGFDVLTGAKKLVLCVDCRDSFQYMISDYIRQTGAEVVTYRAGKNGIPFELLDTIKPDLVFLSPGPGVPDDFKVPDLVLECARRKIPVFGVCLGLQGIVEAFGGSLGVLDTPMHGVSSRIYPTEEGKASGLFLEEEFAAGRYHSLYAVKEVFPECLDVLAHTEDGIIMALKHKDLPIAAVQFHPESIMTMGNDAGLYLIAQAIKLLTCG